MFDKEDHDVLLAANLLWGLSLGVVVQRGSEVARLVYTATPFMDSALQGAFKGL